MANSLAGVVLAAGAGRRLAPLTWERPKALCPVDGVALVDHGLARIGELVEAVAVNLHHGAEQLDRHLPAGVHRSLEPSEALGTAGALAALRTWIDGRAVLLTNADTWFGRELDLSGFVGGWDGERVRLLCLETAGRGDFGALRYCGVALMPWTSIARLAPTASGLYEVSWQAEEVAGRLDLVTHGGRVVDCGTPQDYLRANLLASGGRSVVPGSAQVGSGAELVRTVLWPGAVVRRGERLVDTVRTTSRTVLMR